MAEFEGDISTAGRNYESRAYMIMALFITKYIKIWIIGLFMWSGLRFALWPAC